MRIFSYRDGSAPGVGVMADAESFVALADILPDLPPDLRAILAGPQSIERIRDAVAGRVGNRRVDGIVFEPPIPTPQAIWALALNFKTHIKETGLTTSSEYPQIFLRTAASLVGHRQRILSPPSDLARAFDYEGELAVVIGRGGRHIPPERALDHIAGYTCFNEGSVREFQEHNRQFGLGKNFEASGAFGPWLMTKDELGDPARRSVITRHNGVERQRSLLSDMLFGVEQVVHYLSRGYTLRPGDIIAMGTPGALPPKPGDLLGNDLAQQFGRFKIPGLAHMRPGDVVEVEITGLGVLQNPVAADYGTAYRITSQAKT